MYVFVCVYTCECNVCAGQDSVSALPELKLQAVVSYLTWMLCWELNSGSLQDQHPLTHMDMDLQPQTYILRQCLSWNLEFTGLARLVPWILSP